MAATYVYIRDHFNGQYSIAKTDQLELYRWSHRGEVMCKTLRVQYIS